MFFSGVINGIDMGADLLSPLRKLCATAGRHRILPLAIDLDFFNGSLRFHFLFLELIIPAAHKICTLVESIRCGAWIGYNGSYLGVLPTFPVACPVTTAFDSSRHTSLDLKKTALACANRIQEAYSSVARAEEVAI